ncbi:TerB family tellurite resistance protein [Enterovirga rhinocerotis]|uniref:Tellurite resistance protein TerB n=1 Tax=Enterovirga rhinocerotis TaxID=1339210 RepID=A0A4R7CBG9_9HYPH|nr:TerB family tellurite resistance protein [Enterovirga rhinocerotis]TDR94785.1 hypothetical protein EV668_2074 [Enterovirga rhinocerotis]
MPIVGAIFGAIVMGLIYWIMWGGGLAYIDAALNSRQERKRREQNAMRRIESDREAAKAPLRSITDPREAATALMLAVARSRGEITPEQTTAITGQMRERLGFDGDVDHRLSYCRFAAEKLAAPEAAIDEVAPLLRGALDPHEKEELRAMLEQVSALHGGPTDRQERFVGTLMRRINEAA